MFTSRVWLRLLAMNLFVYALVPSVGSNAAAQSPAIPAPILMLSVNQPVGGAVYSGWPLVIQVDLYHPDFAVDDAPVTPTLLTFTSGSWADAVTITVTDSTGATVNWPLHQVLRPTGADASITLDGQTSSHLAWSLAPSDTSSLPTGTFQVSAVLDTLAVTDPAAFQGRSYSLPVTLTLATEPSVLVPDQQESKYLLAAFYDTLTGNSAQASADVATLLASQPQNVRALVAKGQLLETSGDAVNALSSYDAAVAAFYAATPNSPEPPLELLERSASLRNAAITQAAALPAPRLSLQIQNFAQTSPGIYGLDLQVTNSGAGVANNIAISQITFATVTGTGQVSLDTSVPSQLPASVDTLASGASATVHFSLVVPPGVATFTATEAGTAQNVIGSSSSVSGSETVYVATLSPSFTSASTTSFAAGAAGSFPVTATGAPPPSITESGALPAGVTFTDNGNGSGMLSGTPATGSGGQYSLALQANNGVGSPVTQSFSLTVTEGAAITSANSAVFTVGTAGSFLVKATGYPAPALGESGTLPAGISFVNGTLSGTPAAGSGGTYPITFNATNGVASASQSFALTIKEAPAFTSVSATAFTQGTAGSFKITSTGFPLANLSETGALPAGMAFTNNGNGTATLAGTPTVAGTFNLVLTARNGVGAAATQNFVLTVTGIVTQGATLTVAPGAIDFGNVKRRQSAARIVTLTNTGTTVVRFARIYLTNGPRTDRDTFELERRCASALDPGKSCTLRVVFEAEDLGTSTGVLHILDNAAGSPQLVPLTATTVR